MFWAYLEVGVLTVCWLTVIGLLFARHIVRAPD
jgi:hypothetical protein